jgi:2-oxoglutarate/2-oxoacid ferredoxin oxidoreductase subunit beta
VPFEAGMHEQNKQARARGLGDINALMRKGHTWKVDADPSADPAG